MDYILLFVFLLFLVIFFILNTKEHFNVYKNYKLYNDYRNYVDLNYKNNNFLEHHILKQNLPYKISSNCFAHKSLKCNKNNKLCEHYALQSCVLPSMISENYII